MRIDAHQHFWRYSAAEYGWIQPGSPIQRDFLPPDLAPLLAEHSLAGTVAVQARQDLAENAFLLELADRHPLIQGVVGWVDLRSESVAEQLARFAPHAKFVGVRHVVQDEPDDEFLLREDFCRGVAMLGQFGLTYDILIFPRQLPAAIRFVERLEEQPLVLDHMAKPPVREGRLSPWREQIRELAQYPHVLCKVSGLVTEADWSHWKPSDLRPYLDVVFEAFGPQRLMFGSDWPVCLLAGRYDQVVQVVEHYIAPLSAAEQGAIFGGNAARFYRLDGTAS